MGKKVLVVGQGAREHALVWKLVQSRGVDKVLAAPGNAGIEDLAECMPVRSDDIETLAAEVEKRGIDFTVAGPEVPLMAGIADLFEERGLPVFGPRKAASRLEGSKVFTKELFRKYGIPTADFAVFEDFEEAREFIRQKGAPLVVKADGLAAGKGVVVASDLQEAEAALTSMMKEQSFGTAGRRVVVEECLEGEEVSVFAFSDGRRVLPMTAAQDHKRLRDGDCGPNTGGMGAYSPPPLYTPALHEQTMQEILNPVVRALEAEGCPYRGMLYAGLMVTRKGPKVLEFNARFGDPEAQVILPLLDSDLLDIMEAVAGGNLDRTEVRMKPEAAVCVVLASEGYPGTCPRGREIKGIDRVSPGTLVFHAATRRRDGGFVTDGGRVLSVVSLAPTVKEAISAVYEEVPRISFAGMQYRRDIGGRAIK